MSATDADVGLNGRVHYELDARDREEGSFVIDPASGVIRTNKPLDRESVSTHDLKALAIDGGTPPQSSTVSLCSIIIFRSSKYINNKNMFSFTLSCKHNLKCYFSQI